MPLNIQYFNEELEPARILTFHDEKVFSGQNLPSRIRMVPYDESGSSTEIRYHDLQFDLALEDDFFSLGNLARQGQL